jgi:hypothetical protein
MYDNDRESYARLSTDKNEQQQEMNKMLTAPPPTPAARVRADNRRKRHSRNCSVQLHHFA